MKNRRQLILDCIHDLVIDFMFYDRKDDEELERGHIEEAVTAGEITADDIVAEFRTQLESYLR